MTSRLLITFNKQVSLILCTEFAQQTKLGCEKTEKTFIWRQKKHIITFGKISADTTEVYKKWSPFSIFG